MLAPQSLRRFVIPRTHPFPYAHAQTIQEKIVSEFLSYKAIVSSRNPPKELPTPPIPAVFAFTPEPVYTTGRREVGILTTSQIRQLKEPLVTLGNKHVANICETKRGGQITFHGPGQVVIYPILDIKSIRSERFPNGMTAREYVEVLELTTIDALKQFSIYPFRTEDPGVWVTKEHKIAAVGVHLRRNISSFGVAVNLDTDLRWFDRIVACGLQGKKMTSMMEQAPDIKPKKFSMVWTEMFAIQLWGRQDEQSTYDKMDTKKAKRPLEGGEEFYSEPVTITKKLRRVHGFTFEERLNLLREVADVDTTNLKTTRKRKARLQHLHVIPNPEEYDAPLAQAEEPASLDSDDSDIILLNQLFPVPNPRNPSVPKQPVRWKEVHETELVGIEDGNSIATRDSPLGNTMDEVDGSTEHIQPVYPMSSKPRKDDPTE